MFQMFFWGHVVYIYVIHKDFEKLVQINAKDLNHSPKKRIDQFFHAKRHDCPSK
jgi:hypothetical protein